MQTKAMPTIESGKEYDLEGDYYGDVLLRKVDNVTLINGFFRSIRIKKCNGIYIKGADIQADRAGDVRISSMVHSLASTKITLDGCYIRSCDRIPTAAEDWLDNTVTGISLQAPEARVVDCVITVVDHGIVVTGPGSEVDACRICDFRGDGVRMLGNSSLLRGSIIKDSYDIDANHDDGFQSWPITDNNVVFDVVIARNKFVATTDHTRPFVSKMQGICMFGDGAFLADDWLIVDNTVLNNHYHGITLSRAKDCRITGNTVLIDAPEPISDKGSWIAIAHDDGGNSIENNTCHRINAPDTVAKANNTLVPVGHSAEPPVPATVEERLTALEARVTALEDK